MSCIISQSHSCAMRHAPCAMRRAPPCTLRRAPPCTLRRAPWAVRRAPCAVRRAPCTVRRVPWAVCRAPCAIWIRQMDWLLISWPSCNYMLLYVELPSATLRYAMLRYATLCYAMLWSVRCTYTSISILGICSLFGALIYWHDKCMKMTHLTHLRCICLYAISNDMCIYIYI